VLKNMIVLTACLFPRNIFMRNFLPISLPVSFLFLTSKRSCSGLPYDGLPYDGLPYDGRAAHLL
jgi:hypothetical protein